MPSFFVRIAESRPRPGTMCLQRLKIVFLAVTAIGSETSFLVANSAILKKGAKIGVNISLP
jgi:hypothetical protein